ncbi:MAG: hypothetical protein R3C05_23055 [Pirellulaceae bacterium]
MKSAWTLFAPSAFLFVVNDRYRLQSVGWAFQTAAGIRCNTQTSGFLPVYYFLPLPRNVPTVSFSYSPFSNGNDACIGGAVFGPSPICHHHDECRPSGPRRE